ncbi:YraN family protein [Aliiroseovarius sp.]|uniref:YraN family protein n=1 Tax=Aliiroseovarius sp. TaxID=1872442 RepID=UPI00262EE43B|nr:YraN family protein [Aliiroseovarius sp.]
MSGMTSYLAGQSAESSVEADYARRGYPVAARRWRGSRGELDIVLRDGKSFVFVEVKKARSFARAAERLTRAQINRIWGAAQEFVAREPKGLLTEMRFDVALVNERGEVQIMENAYAY